MHGEGLLKGMAMGMGFIVISLLGWMCIAVLYISLKRKMASCQWHARLKESPRGRNRGVFQGLVDFLDPDIKTR